MAAIVDQLRQLHADLKFQYERDSEQELDATILPLIDSIVAEARGLLPEGSTVGEQMQASSRSQRSRMLSRFGSLR